MSKKKTTRKAAKKATKKTAKKVVKKTLTKTASKKAVKKAAKKAVKKAAKKVAKNKSVKKPIAKVAKKVTAKKTTLVKKKTVQAKKAGSKTKAATKTVDRELLQKRTRKATPSIFKIKARKNTPILFTLEDVKDIIEKRKSEEQEIEAQSQVKKTSKSAKKKSKPTQQSSVRGAASLSDILGFSPAKKAKQKVAQHQVDESTIPKKWLKYYRSLVKMKDQLLKGLDLHTKETLHRSNKEDSGNLSNYGQHMADVGTENFDRDFALSLVSSEQEALSEIEAAIQRILNGSYGVCEITGKSIKKERLAAVPFTRYSLEGQRQLESMPKRHNQRAATLSDLSGDDAVTFSDDDE